MARSEHPTGQENPYEHYEPYGGTSALRSQIARARADLGDTVQELAARADVKARAKEMAWDVRERAKQALRARTRKISERTRDMTRSGAASVRQGLGRAEGTPAWIACGAGAGALVGYGIYGLLRRRMRPRGRAYAMWRRASRKGRRSFARARRGHARGRR